MRYALSGWCEFYRERRRHRDTQDAYDNLVVAHQGALRRLQVEEQRATDAVLRLMDDCGSCELLTRERNDALLELDTMRAERDEWQEAAQFMERIGFGSTRADGSPA
jgi:hypothetical protein